MTDQTLEQRLRAFYRDGDSQPAPVLLRRRVAAIADVEALPARRRMNARSFVLLAAAALLTVALVGSAVIGASLLRVNSIVLPSPSPAATLVATAPPSTSQPSPSTSARPSATASTPGIALIAYTRSVDKPNTRLGSGNGAQCLSAFPTCAVSRIWLIAADGTGAHELMPGGVQNQQVLGWSSDGSHLLYHEYLENGGATNVTDASGAQGQLVDTGCALPCIQDNYVTFAPDGTHLVFARSNDDGSYRIATIDLASGQILELTSTTSTREALLPGWSPTGTQIVFWRPGDKDFGGPITPVKSAIFIVDADGQNLHQISPEALPAESPRWSTDGTRIVFTSSDASTANVYSMRPDGSDVRQLTSDATSTDPSWTPDGRILFDKYFGGVNTGAPPVFWTMDADGANAAQLIPEDVTQAAGGGLWQPAGGSAVVPPPWNAATGSPVGPPAPTPLATPVPPLAAGFSWTGSTLPSQHGSPDTATLLSNGQVLVTMGCDPVAELYDPQTGEFIATGAMTTARGSASATLLTDGRVLVAGGGDCSDASGILASAELYDPTTGTFSPTGSMSARRQSHSATLLNDGRVLLAGGVTDQVTTGGSAVILASYNDRLIAETAAGTTLASAELYDPRTGTFSPTGSMADFRSNFTATLLQDGHVLVAGGGGEGYARASAELYDPQTGTFSPTGSMTKARWLHSATLLDSGQVLVAGGRSPNDVPYASAEVYSPSSGRFTPTGQMDAARQQHTATLLPDGRVLVAGGYTADRHDWNLLSSTEIYDPGTGQFSSSGSMGDARDGGLAARLADGRVLILGGEGIGTDSLIELSSAVIYQP